MVFSKRRIAIYAGATFDDSRKLANVVDRALRLRGVTVIRRTDLSLHTYYYILMFVCDESMDRVMKLQYQFDAAVNFPEDLYKNRVKDALTDDAIHPNEKLIPYIVRMEKGESND